MIKDIIELNFPSYATLSQATVTLNDMGDKTISAQVKIFGHNVPDFSYDWEVQFQGERYIHPIREPQASKGNESICSTIDLTFQHWTIYQLRRYFFVEMTTTESGTAMADKYIASLSVNLKTFCDAFQRVLDYYYNGEINIDLNSEWVYDEKPQYIEINYTHIWDMLQKVYEVFGVRWSIEGTVIKVGYPTEVVSHIFEYGFKGGLLKVERQVQSTDIRNSLLGRGGEKNLPYRYFKDTDPNTPNFTADPDWIPELANIYFTELRGKTFRDYVKGWKAKHYGGEVMTEPTEAYTKGYTDTVFNPIEYVEDKVSIAKYGTLQGGLENQEDIYPSIQGVEVEPYGRIDQIVGAEQVVVDETEDSLYTPQFVDSNIADFFSSDKIVATDVENEYILKSDTIHQSLDGYVGEFIGNPVFKTTAFFSWFDYTWHLFERRTLDTEFISATLIDAETGYELIDTVTIPEGLKFKVEYRVRIKPIEGLGGVVTSASTSCNSEWRLVNNPLNGVLLKNIDADGNRISESVTIDSDSTSIVTLQTDVFEVLEDGATNVDVPINILADSTVLGLLYEWQRSVEAVNVDTNEVVSSINIPQGTYYLRVKVEISNNSASAQAFTVQLMPAYVYFPIDTEEWQPTFDIWVKNIWGTTRNEGESVEAYTERVWTPILGDREGNEAKIVFTTGWLSGHSDYEFKITNVAYAGNEGVEHEGIPAEWRITLAKSDAELEATGLYIPSTKQQANAGDYFFFIGIDMPHQYVLWAEERLDDFKRNQLLETANIKPTWVVQTDKVRLNQLQDGETEPLLNSLKVGNSIRLADVRFISSPYETLYLQSVTYSWGTDTIIMPNVEVVLSDKVATISNPIQQIQGEINALSKQVGSLSNVQQIMRTIGDRIYLRKDGVEELCKSPIEFFKSITSRGFRQGAVGGSGWGLRTDGEKGILEVDKLVVRDDLQINALVSNQVTAVGGKQIESAASILCSRVDATEDGFVCYFDQKQGSIANLFQVGDIAYSQVFSSDNAQMKYYKREVIAVGANSITLSLVSDGDGMPQVGDTIVHYGNTTDTNRQYVIIRDVIGGGYERMLSDLNSVTSTGVEYYFAGRMEGDTPRWFVGDKREQYIEYKDGTLRIVGNVILGEDSDLNNVPDYQNIRADVDAIKELSDKQYTIWFFDPIPTLTNEPAVNWGTNEEKQEHDQDLYYSGDLGRAWRFEFVDSVYSWNEITDADTLVALGKADQAISIASNTESNLSDFQSAITKELENIQSQLDGTIESYFYEYDPTLDNIPASEWTTKEEKEAHLNDTFTNTLTGNSWRWTKTNGSYIWVEIADTTATKALALAIEAKDTADGKRRTFVDTPYPPYDEGDLWAQGGDGDLLVCTHPREKGANFVSTDWVKSSDYTNDDTANRALKISLNNGEKISSLTTRVDEQSATIDQFGTDLETIKEQSDKEYTIWFEPDTQEGQEPTLSNYPASDWNTDELLQTHLQDLYYADSIGRAWRFEYTNGVYGWNEITDANTIAALDKAQEALNKANNAQEGVDAIGYLKETFPNAFVLNYGASLALLLGVMDSNNVIKAGMYGGGSDTLNNAIFGYKDATHGTLCFFAGATNAIVKNSKYRVYEDGTVFANQGVFGGVLKKSPTTITPDNLSRYALSTDGQETVLNLAKTGSLIIFSGEFTNTPQFRLPSIIDNGDLDTQTLVWTPRIDAFPSDISYEEALTYIGAQVILVNNTDYSITGCNHSHCLVLEPKQTMVLDCVMIACHPDSLPDTNTNFDRFGVGWNMSKGYNIIKE